MNQHAQRSIEGQGLYVQMYGDSKIGQIFTEFTLPVISHWNGMWVGHFVASCSLFHKLNNYNWVFIGISKFTVNILYQGELKPDLKKKKKEVSNLCSLSLCPQETGW